ncbi:lipase member K [Fopius arisanus]|uniref:Lipase n=1 Tax=Fopius arisanus TaxID=64838 RepID=A0A0C9PTG5_9HYME|nr:PREDICTED: lipase member K-like [Fopius arisanus]
MIVSGIPTIFCMLFLVAYSYSSILTDIFRIQQVRTPVDATGLKYYALDFIGLVQQYGYKAETHEVTTQDGYILSVGRVLPNGSGLNKSAGSQVVFLQHGMAGSADCFVLFAPNISLAYQLSDAGYDVWLGNLRGNTYSRRHTTVSPEDPLFWDFSLDEYATLDLAAMTDYVLNYTEQPSVSYVGHSIGSTIVSLLLAERPEYNEKINLMILLAPLCPWKTMTPARLFLIQLARLGKKVTPNGAAEMSSQTTFMPLFYENVCLANDYTAMLCYAPLKFFFGADGRQTSIENLKLFSRYYPAGTSIKVAYYLLQQLDSGVPRHFDYEDEGINIQRYGQIQPPVYNLSNIISPMVLFSGINDPLALKEDVDQYSKNFQRVKKLIHEPINYTDFGHFDFLSAKDIKELVYNRLLEILNDFHRE